MFLSHTDVSLSLSSEEISSVRIKQKTAGSFILLVIVSEELQGAFVEHLRCAEPGLGPLEWTAFC